MHANSSELDAKVASYRESTCETGSPMSTVNLPVSAEVRLVRTSTKANWTILRIKTVKY